MGSSNYWSSIPTFQKIVLFQGIDSEQLVIEQLYLENILLPKGFHPNVACVDLKEFID